MVSPAPPALYLWSREIRLQERILSDGVKEPWLRSEVPGMQNRAPGSLNKEPGLLSAQWKQRACGGNVHHGARAVVSVEQCDGDRFVVTQGDLRWCVQRNGTLRVGNISIQWYSVTATGICVYNFLLDCTSRMRKYSLIGPLNPCSRPSHLASSAARPSSA